MLPASRAAHRRKSALAKSRFHASLAQPMAALSDTFGRPVRDLRISVTDRCNFRCPYCMPKESFGPEHPFLAAGNLMTHDELVRIAGVFVGLGVEKIRLTGGEPLLRADLPAIIRSIKGNPG